jgi:lipopolysaccharide transport system ATP-binding protein
MSTVIKVEKLSKQYRLGLVGASTFKEDAQRWWAKMRGKEDPFVKLGVENDRTIFDNSKFVWSLKDINFEVQEGDVLGVIGRNGAGKSTLLKILSRVTAPTTGSVKVKGRIASLLEVGTGFHPELTGRENIYLNGAILGMRKHEITRQLDEIIAFAGVEKYIDTPVKRYSSGMYVRLAFAVAAHLESDILILDEVLAVGDAEFQKKCLGKMGDISKNDGRTILFVSHSMVSVQQLCNKGLLLENGRAVSFSDKTSIINDYLNQNLKKSDSSDNLILNTDNILRSKGNNPIIDKVWIINSKGVITRSILMGEDFEICFSFKSKSTLNNVLFGFGIEDSYGVRITSVNNEITGDEIPYTIYNGVAKLKVKEPNLLFGKYYLSLSLVSNQYEWIDYIEQAFTFEIIESDIYNSGKMLESSHGKIFINGKIEINEYI